MSKAFRDLLRKIGSGPHTGEDLTREEAAAATEMMLRQEATPAQIGAFMIAHRIRRPTGTELAGMLDAYDRLGPQLQPLPADRPVMVFSSPYDGRSRTAALSPITALILAAAGVAVILHGGDRMPTKEGVPLIDLWQGLGVCWDKLSLAQVQRVLEQTGLGFVYLPRHFPLAYGLVPYREQIGKRPPLATLELMWSPYAGQAHLVAGFVHPPTEMMFCDALALRGTTQFTTVKGLEGSCDLPRDRTAIIGLQGGHQLAEAVPAQVDGVSHPTLMRLHLHPRDYDLAGKDAPLPPTPELLEGYRAVLHSKPSDLTESVLWNGGFYLWRMGVCPSFEAGLARAETILQNGEANAKLADLIGAFDTEVHNR